MTPRLSLPLAVLLSLTAGALAYFIYFGQWFPPQVAVRFTPAGDPALWMDRIKFIVIGTSVSFMLPPFVVALMGVLPRALPVSVLSLPNKAYWLAPERREATLTRLLYFALWLGCLLQAFLLCSWILIGRSNPAGLAAHAAPGQSLLAGGFLLCGLGFVWWVNRAFARAQ